MRVARRILTLLPCLSLSALLAGCPRATSGTPSSADTDRTKSVACQSASDCTGELPTTCHKCASGKKACAHWSCASNACKVAYCGSSGGSSSGTSSSGGSSGGMAIGPQGGTLANLTFGLIGDTRPPSSDDVAGYPTAVVAGAFSNMAHMSPAPAFAVASGDFMFSDDSSNPSASTATQQAGLYLSAVWDAGFSNQLFLALGNHECNTATTSNCGTGNADGVTPNYSAFLSMLSQVGLGSDNPSPYYTFDISSTADVSPAWTAKFVVIACNAWDDTQQSWLQSALATSTTYTFIVRHETVEEDQEPGVPASPCGMASSAMIAPYANQGQVTLLLTGHTHYYKINDQPTDVVTGGAPGVTLNVPEIVAGNGGAQLRSDATDYGADGYGFVVCQQTPDANAGAAPDIACQEYDATTGVPSSAKGGFIQVSATGALISGG